MTVTFFAVLAISSGKAAGQLTYINNVIVKCHRGYRGIHEFQPRGESVYMHVRETLTLCTSSFSNVYMSTVCIIAVLCR